MPKADVIRMNESDRGDLAVLYLALHMLVRAFPRRLAVLARAARSHGVASRVAPYEHFKDDDENVPLARLPCFWERSIACAA